MTRKQFDPDFDSTNSKGSVRRRFVWVSIAAVILVTGLLLTCRIRQFEPVVNVAWQPASAVLAYPTDAGLGFGTALGYATSPVTAPTTQPLQSDRFVINPDPMIDPSMVLMVKQNAGGRFRFNRLSDLTPAELNAPMPEPGIRLLNANPTPPDLIKYPIGRSHLEAAAQSGRSSGLVPAARRSDHAK